MLAKEAKVAYALVWQTYYDSAATDDRYFYYYVPFPGHPDAATFQRFYADPATCFLRDAPAGGNEDGNAQRSQTLRRRIRR